MPTFELPAVSHPETRVRPTDFEGQVWLLNVWATWCTACREEHGVLLTAAREHAVSIVGLDYKDERIAAVRWLDRLGDPYVVSAFDPEGEIGLDLASTAFRKVT